MNAAARAGGEKHNRGPPLDTIGSTSWHNRHLASFQELNRILWRETAGELVVMIVGPGAVTAVLSPLLNDAARPGGRLRRLVGDAARYADQLLRRVPCLPLQSLEPAEVEAVLTRPHRLVVVDHSPRTLEAAARQLPGAECHCIDITTASPPAQADAVIAFNVICRVQDPAAGIRHVVQAVRPGGWLLIDDRSAQAHLLPAHPEFTLVVPKTYRRRLALAACRSQS